MTYNLEVYGGLTQSVVAGLDGNAYHLNGLHVNQGGNYLSVAKDPALFGQEQLTFSVAFKADPGSDGGSLFRIHTALEIVVTDDGQVVFDLIENNAGESGLVASSGLDVNDGAWHTVTLTYDAIAGAMTGYVDGQAVGAVPVSAPTKVAEAWSPMIGDPWGSGFTGLIDNVSFFGAALSPDEVAGALAGEPIPQEPGTDPVPDDGSSDPTPPTEEPATTEPLFGLDFEGGSLADSSGNGLAITAGSDGSIQNGAYRLNGLHVSEGGNWISMERDASLFSQDQVSIQIDFKTDTPGVGGSLFRVHTAMEIEVLDSGEIAFKLQENSVGESGTIASSGFNVTDGAWHTLTLTYDAVGGAMTGYIDGTEAGSIAVSGPTQAAESWDPMIGNPWGSGFAGLIDNVRIENGVLTPGAGETLTALGETLTVEPTLTTEPTLISAGITLEPSLMESTTGPQEAASVPEDGIVVDDAAAFIAALQNATGGETILLRAGVDYGGLVRYSHASAPVTITSLDPGNQATIGELTLRDCHNLTFDNLHFAFEGTPTQYQIDIEVRESDNIAFTNSIFKGIATGYAAPDALHAQNMMAVVDSSNFTFANNEVSHYMHAVAATRTAGLDIRNNEFHSMQGDGMRFSQLNDLTVENNYLHDFLGAAQNVTHTDYIQFWTTNTTAPSTDIVIRGNLMTSSNEQNQAIFFRDEMGDNGLGEMRYQNVLIEDNVIYNNHPRGGITLPSTDGAIVRGNSVIFHPEGDAVSAIGVTKSTGVQVYDNFAPSIYVASDSEVVRFDDNYIIQNEYPIEEGFVGDLFQNPLHGAGAVLDDLLIVPDSALEKSDGTVYGSEMLNLDESPEDLTAFIVAAPPQTSQSTSFGFDARYTANAAGLVSADDARFVWDFGDGRSAEGMAVNHTYAAPGEYEVLLSVMHDDGTSDAARYDAIVEAPLAAVMDFDDGSLTFDNYDAVWGS